MLTLEQFRDELHRLVQYTDHLDKFEVIMILEAEIDQLPNAVETEVVLPYLPGFEKPLLS